MRKPTQLELQDALAGVLNMLGSSQGEVPSHLYHYTSAEGLRGILDSKCLWLTDLRYMNDFSELQYARDKIVDYSAEAAQSLDGVKQEFLLRISRSYGSSLDVTSVFSASFCENGNLLSQWRAYRGQGGGYAIGFDWFLAIQALDRRCSLMKVIYEPVEQDKIIKAILSDYLNLVEQLDGDVDLTRQQDNMALADVVQACTVALAQAAPSIKHPDFAEEREWRLVHSARPNPVFEREVEIPRFRTFEGNLIPYFPVSFDKAIQMSKDDTLGYPFLISKIHLGPTVSAELNESSVRLLLSSLNPDAHPAIERSEIPIRWL